MKLKAKKYFTSFFGKLNLFSGRGGLFLFVLLLGFFLVFNSLSFFSSTQKKWHDAEDNLKKGNYQVSSDLFEEIYQSEGSDESKFDLGVSKFKEGKYEESYNVFESMKDKDISKKGLIEYQIGTSAYKVAEKEVNSEKMYEKYKESLAYFELSIKKDPKNIKSKENYETAKQKIKIIENLRKLGIKLNKEELNTLFSAMKKIEEAKNQAEKNQNNSEEGQGEKEGEPNSSQNTTPQEKESKVEDFQENQIYEPKPGSAFVGDKNILFHIESEKPLPSQYFKTSIFSIFQNKKLITENSNIKQAQNIQNSNSEFRLKFKTDGNNIIAIPTLYGYYPSYISSGEIFVSENGNYFGKNIFAGDQYIEFSLLANDDFSSYLNDNYTQKIPVSQEISSYLDKAKNDYGDIESTIFHLGREIQSKKYSNQYQKTLYDNANSNEDYLDILKKAKEMDCYSANTLIIAYLRYYGIPSRMRVGFLVETGETKIADKNGHGWAEYYFNGKWNILDATPQRSDGNSFENMSEQNIDSLKDILDGDKKPNNSPSNSEQSGNNQKPEEQKGQGNQANLSEKEKDVMEKVKNMIEAKNEIENDLNGKKKGSKESNDGEKKFDINSKYNEMLDAEKQAAIDGEYKEILEQEYSLQDYFNPYGDKTFRLKGDPNTMDMKSIDEIINGKISREKTYEKDTNEVDW